MDSSADVQRVKLGPGPDVGSIVKLPIVASPGRRHLQPQRVRRVPWRGEGEGDGGEGSGWWLRVFGSLASVQRRGRAKGRTSPSSAASASSAARTGAVVGSPAAPDGVVGAPAGSGSGSGSGWSSTVSAACVEKGGAGDAVLGDRKGEVGRGGAGGGDSHRLSSRSKEQARVRAADGNRRSDREVALRSHLAALPLVLGGCGGGCVGLLRRLRLLNRWRGWLARDGHLGHLKRHTTG